MAKLEKAYIVEISAGPEAKEIPPRFPVQFNPTSLKLQISTCMAVGKTCGSQEREATGSSSTTLTLELVFDTSDEGSTNAPRSVREKTAQIERFVFPKSQTEDSQKQPKIRFQWGSFVIDGVVDSVNVDLDHFAADGTPLRAKVSLSIEEQNSKLIFLKAGPGSNQKGNAPNPLGAAAGALGISGGLGISGSLNLSGGLDISGGLGLSAGVNAQFGVALGGESLPEFAARVGLDPIAWRGLSTDISGGLSGDLSLQAGAEVGFSADLNASAGIGVTLGVEAGVSASLEASFGLEADAGISAVAGVGVGADLAAGFALAAGGGLNAALATVQIAKSQAAEQQARQAFGAPATAVTASAGAAVTTALSPAVPPKPALPEQPRPPLGATGLPSPSQQQIAAPAPPPPRADPRSASFGFGVPLRSTVGEAATHRADSLLGGVALRQQVGDGLPPSSDDPTVPPWIALPGGDRARTIANQQQKKLHPARPCGCSGRCRHPGGQ